jgi:hypothetical protein
VIRLRRWIAVLGLILGPAAARADEATPPPDGGTAPPAVQTGDDEVVQNLDLLENVDLLKDLELLEVLRGDRT